MEISSQTQVTQVCNDFMLQHIREQDQHVIFNGSLFYQLWYSQISSVTLYLDLHNYYNKILNIPETCEYKDNLNMPSPLVLTIFPTLWYISG